MDSITLLTMVRTGSVPAIFKQLDYKSENSELTAVEELVSQFPKLIKSKDEFMLVVRVLASLSSLEKYIQWAEYPIHINEFKDKYGNRYLQARTSIKGENGKTKWISAYVGSVSDFPKGTQDPAAFDKARPLIRKKLKKFFGLK
jgi:hypothetical protein